MRAPGSTKTDPRGRRLMGVQSSALLLLPVVLLACGSEVPPQGDGVLTCTPPARVAKLENVHYPDASCGEATRLAEGRSSMAVYLRACQQLAPSAGMPRAVSDISVSACTHVEDAQGFGPGALLEIEVCCP